MTARTVSTDKIERDLRETAAAASAFTSERDWLICQLHKRKKSLRHIGELAGLSHTAIAKIIAR